MAALVLDNLIADLDLAAEASTRERGRKETYVAR